MAIGLGANSGAPAAQLKEAMTRLAELAVGEIKVSSMWRSEAVDMQDQSGEFVNAVIAFDCQLPPLTLLRRMQAVEVAMGRPADHERYVARPPLDLDLLLYGEEQISEPDLLVPHPRMLERLFVLLPLQEVWPDYTVGDADLKTLIQLAPDMAIERL
ncbi:MAG: 2-amino-4-hydroxy-6-hydroxymethyldihydropteridine diphosphokinase [Pseudomonadales bacterium]